MAFSFSKRYNTERQFDIDTTDFTYISLEDLWIRVGQEDNVPVRIWGVYINTKGKFEPAPVVAIDDYYVNLPAHMTEVCRQMLKDEECVKAINAGKCGMTVYSYVHPKHKRECFSVKWCDME